jgi:hypothetical protein
MTIAAPHNTLLELEQQYVPGERPRKVGNVAILCRRVDVVELQDANVALTAIDATARPQVREQPRVSVGCTTGTLGSDSTAMRLDLCSIERPVIDAAAR